MRLNRLLIFTLAIATLIGEAIFRQLQLTQMLVSVFTISGCYHAHG
jgi:hypothetical protein